METKLYIVIPCYNEEEVLAVTSKLFLEELMHLIQMRKIHKESRILFVDDGSTDCTWKIICELALADGHFIGIKQSRNRGHQNAVLAGLMEAKDLADITISIDCDGQDDIHAIEKMVDAYHAGSQIVYGVRKSRETDTFFKRVTAEEFYKILNWMGIEAVFNHADYRLISSKVLQEFAKFKEVNLFLRGMVPLVGFSSTNVYYERKMRVAGESHYPLKKMVGLAFDGITSLSIKPVRMIAVLGIIVSFCSFIGVAWSIIVQFMGKSVAGWASIVSVVCLIGGMQFICLGVLGEYIGKIYLEVKARPRYIIEERTFDLEDLQ